MAEQALNILVCEDERIFALELSDRLRDMGHHVVDIVASGAEALSSAGRHRPDLVLMDIHLQGGMLGTEVANLLERDLQIPSIFLTAYADNSTLGDARFAHPLGYLVKPIRDQELRMAIEFGYPNFKIQRVLKNELHDYKLVVEGSDFVRNHPEVETSGKPLFHSRMEAMEDVVGSIAHHMNNKLCGIFGYLELLLAKGSLMPFEQRQLESAQAGCNQLQAIIKKMLWASQRGANFVSIASMSALLSEAVQNAKSHCPDRVKLVVRLEEVGCSVFVDKEALVLALSEVLSNAIEAIPENGNVQVTLDRELIPNPEGRNLHAQPGLFSVITVLDDGVGIPVESLGRLFEPFYSTKEHENVLGLGLAIAFGVFQRNNGWIEVVPRTQGTCVKMFVPIATPH